MIFRRKHKEIPDNNDKIEKNTTVETTETEAEDEKTISIPDMVEKSTTAEVEVTEENKIEEEEKKRKWYNKEWFYFSISPLFTMIMLSIIMGEDFVSGFKSNMFLPFVVKNVITYVFILSLTYFLSKVLVKKIIAVYAVNILLYVFGVSTIICITKTGNPIMPGDFLLTNKLGQLVGFIQISVTANMVWGAVFLILILAAYTYLNKKFVIKKTQTLKQKIIFGIISFVIIFLNIYLLGFNTFVARKILLPLEITVSESEPKKDYENNGLVLFFVTHLSDLVIQEPEGYGSECISAIIDKYNLGINKFNEYSTPKNVNIIAIQSETFWDVTRLPNTYYTVDPMQHIHAMSEEYISGYLVTPVLGCNTCMPEFEFLTGTSVTLLKKGSYPYIQYVTHDIDAMPRVFGNNGYATRAIHTYDKTYYKRDSAYEYMAFDKFVGSQDLENPEYKGFYISDMEMTRLIIDEYKNKGDKPMFLYAVSMQNHGGYMEERYDSYDVDVSSDVLNENELMQLKISAQGIYDIDQSFYALTEYFKDCDEPVILIIYGDHLSYLGEGISVFEKTGYVSNRNLRENIQMYETPYLIWANFDISNIDVPKRLSPAKLGITAMKLARLKNVPEHYGYLDNLYKEYPIIHPYCVVNSKGETSEKLPDEIGKEFNLIQYDYIVGKKYSGNMLK